MILDVIKNKPGIGFNSIKEHTKLSNGVLSHYILQLLKNEKITKSGIRARYFVHGFPERDMNLIMIFSNTTNFKIIKVLLENRGPLKISEITKNIGKSLSTVSVNIKKMEKLNIVSRKIMNQNTKLTSDIGYMITDKELIKKIILRYNLE